MLKFATDFFIDGPGAILGLTRREIQTTVDHPDHQEIVQLGKSPPLHVTLSLGQTASSKRPLLVVTEAPGSNATVSDAWPIPDGILPEDVTPLRALEALCESFGAVVHVGDRSGRFLLSTSVSGVRSQNDVLGMIRIEPEGNDILQTGAMAVQVTGPDTAEVYLAFAINLSKLRRALRSS